MKLLTFNLAVGIAVLAACFPKYALPALIVFVALEIAIFVLLLVAFLVCVAWCHCGEPKEERS